MSRSIVCILHELALYQGLVRMSEMLLPVCLMSWSRSYIQHELIHIT